MKSLAFFIAFASLICVCCVGNPEGKKAETTESVAIDEKPAIGITYIIDTTQSQLVWKGNKISTFHQGNVFIKSGNVFINSGIITGGNFVIDMTTISNNDLKGEDKDKLLKHLKSDDFFAVSIYPEATFEITGVKAGNTPSEVQISGNLTIKAISKNITFDAKIQELSDSLIKCSADFNIKRADWGINYEGKKDDLISKEINFKISIVAKK